MYTGVTSDLVKRVWEHRETNGSRFTGRYGVHRLVHAEEHDDIADAICREKVVRRWRREWKFALIEAANPHWNDLPEANTAAGSPLSRG